MATPEASLSDSDLISRAQKDLVEEKLLAAARLLRQVKDKSKLQERHLRDITAADEFETAIEDISTLTPKADGWVKQTEKHAKYDTAIWYKVGKNHQLTCRMEAAIPSSLLVPIIGAMNECELYKTWMPSWKFPRIGYRRVARLKDIGRGHLIYQVVVDLPPPYFARDAVAYARAIDDIDHGSKIIVRAKHLKTKEDDECVPDLERKTVRIDLDATIVIQPCPLDHPLLLNSKIHYPKGERILLFTVKQTVDAHVSYVPLSLINFFTRQFLQTFLISFLSVGVAIRDGKHPEYQEAMNSKPELYKWVQGRVALMFGKLGTTSPLST